MGCRLHQLLWAGLGRSNVVCRGEAGIKGVFFSGPVRRGMRRKIDLLVIFTLTTLLLCVGFLVDSTRPVYAGMSFVEGVWLTLWPGGRIPFKISPSLMTDGKIDKTIAAALYSWGVQTHSAITFQPVVSTDNRWVHIMTRSEFMNLPQGKGEQPTCGSWGPQPQGATYTWLTKPDCVNMWSVLHEVGHVMGLGHEHLRPDRQGYMTIKAYNPDFRENAPVGFFDHFSIMHSHPVLQASIPRSSSIPTPWPLPIDLSKGDKDTVRALYAFDIRPNSDILGGDYANFPLVPEATQRDCQLACAADVRCTAYTYAAAGVLSWNNPAPHCYLKGDGRPIPDFSARPGVNIHSGKRRDKQQGSFGAARHVDLVGGQISGGVVNMPYNVLNGKNCKEVCLDDPNCQAYTFAPGWDSGKCYKKSHNPPPGEPRFKYVQHRDFLSGVVR